MNGLRVWAVLCTINNFLCQLFTLSDKFQRDGEVCYCTCFVMILSMASIIVNTLVMYRESYGSRKSNNYIIRRKTYYDCIFHYLYYAASALRSFIRYPRLFFKYVTLRVQGQLIKVDMDQYYKDFCLESEYPDQNGGKSLYKRFTESECFDWWITQKLNFKPRFFRFTQLFRKKNDDFDLCSLEEAVLDRFIELLPSPTLREFSKTSKNMHYKCLNSRGIEFCYYNAETPKPDIQLEGFDTFEEIVENAVENILRSKGIVESKNSRLIGSAKYFLEQQQLERFILCRDTLRWSGSDEIAPAVNKTYRQLVLTFDANDFNDKYNYALQNLLHDGVKSVKLFIHRTKNPDYGNFPTLEKLMEFLEACADVSKICICFHELRYMKYVLSLNPPAFIQGNPPFSDIRERLEEHFLSKPNLKRFKLIYNSDGYLLHEGKLKLMEQFVMRKWYLTDGSSSSKKLNPDADQNYFLQQLESPYYSVPSCYYEYVV